MYYERFICIPFCVNETIFQKTFYSKIFSNLLKQTQICLSQKKIQLISSEIQFFLGTSKIYRLKLYPYIPLLQTCYIKHFLTFKTF